MKKYLANTAVSVSVILPNGKSTRISFSSLSNGTSVFYTDDKDIQWGLEHHYKFGKLFRLVEDTGEKKNIVSKKPMSKEPVKAAPKKASGKKPKQNTEAVPAEAPAPADEAVEEVPTQEDSAADTDSDDESAQESPYREVTVSDMDDAKDYLAEHYDVVRTKLKSEESIREAALAFGIVFKYL